MSINDEGQPINAFFVAESPEVVPCKSLGREIGWDEYLELKAMNGSTLAHGKKSMLHLKHAIDTEFVPRPAMKLGTATHALLLEPEQFKARFVVMPPFHLDPGNMRKAKNKIETDADRRTESKATTYYKTKAREFHFDAESRKLEVVEQEQFDLALAMIQAVRSKRAARAWLEDPASRFEATVVGEIEGVKFKGRIDICLLYTSPSPRDQRGSRMPSSA